MLFYGNNFAKEYLGSWHFSYQGSLSLFGNQPFCPAHPCSMMQPSGNNTSMTVLSILEHSENSLHEINCLWHKCKAVLNSWKALDEVSGNYVRFFERVPLATLCQCTHLLLFYAHMPFSYRSSMLVQSHDEASIIHVFLRQYDSDCCSEF